MRVKESRLKFALATLITTATLVFSAGVIADDSTDTQAENEVCRDNNVLSAKLFTDVCWGCIFPIKVAGATLGPSGEVPDDAATGMVCACADGLGVYHPGILSAMWEPRRFIELTRTPGCMSSLGGAKLDLGSELQYGTQTDGAQDERLRASISFYNAHMYAMPLLRMLDLYLPGDCNADPYSDFDIISFTEIDPTWNNTTLAFFQNPESAAVSNIIAQQACAVEAAAQFAGSQPQSTLWWCAGSWGGQYPLTGSVRTMDTPRTTSLAATRQLAVEHRRGLAYRSVGNDVACRAKIYPTIPKQQYKLNMFYPTPETKKGHNIGESPYKWQGGMFRYPTGMGQDSTYMIFQWSDCCRTL
ncbi:TraU family protein (plasmid) [Klebsiella pneumoniae]|uniref:TraU family protein n=1 Tax=Klebsiella pneumoniae TaxID=573 RepID=UPI0035BC7663